MINLVINIKLLAEFQASINTYFLDYKEIAYIKPFGIIVMLIVAGGPTPILVYICRYINSIHFVRFQVGSFIYTYCS